uniref:Protein kinase domain-containing protein n=1 Tax=Eptatretus burgeri TaxID=7764 RepID=A0A8C4R792_EPTBU
MSLLQSAFDFLSGSATRDDNDFVGHTVELGDLRLGVKRVIAEGGYAFVYEAQDLENGREYALKRLLSDDEEKSKTIMQEVCLMRRLSGHANIVQFVSAASVGKEESDTGKAEFLILTELCQGQLVDALKQAECRGPLPSDTVLKIFYQTCRAVQHLHRQNPPITHRDLKIENLLLSSQATIKLCDFGSATTARHSPNYSWSAARRANVEEEVCHKILAFCSPHLSLKYRFYLVYYSCQPSVSVSSALDCPQHDAHLSCARSSGSLFEPAHH